MKIRPSKKQFWLVQLSIWGTVSAAFSFAFTCL